MTKQSEFHQWGVGDAIEYVNRACEFKLNKGGIFKYDTIESVLEAFTGIRPDPVFIVQMIEVFQEQRVPFPHKLKANVPLYKLVPTPVNPKRTSDTKPLYEALDVFASKDDLKSALTGVYIDGKKKNLVATDANIMMIYHHSFNPLYEINDGKILDIKQMVKTNKGGINFIDGKYPDYTVVLPDKKSPQNLFEHMLDPEHWFNFAASMMDIRKYIDPELAYKRDFVYLDIGGIKKGIDIRYLRDMMKFAVNFGLGAMDVSTTESEGSAFVFWFSSGSIGLIMPIHEFIKDNDTAFNRFDIAKYDYNSGTLPVKVKSARKKPKPQPLMASASIEKRNTHELVKMLEAMILENLGEAQA
jgi:hypothetical protein